MTRAHARTRPIARTLRAGLAGVVAVGALAWLSPGEAPGQSQDRRARDRAAPSILIDRELRERRVVLESIDADQVRFLSPEGLSRSMPIRDVFAILPERNEPEPAPAAGAIPWPQMPPPFPMDHAPPPAPSATGLAELRTGERFPGRLLASETDRDPGDRVRWLAPVVGEVSIALDDLDRLTLQPYDDAALADRDAFSDTVLLVNGDVLRGFVESIAGAIVLEIDAGSIRLEADRVASVRFADAPAPPSPTHLVALREGVVLGGRELLPAPQGAVRLALARDAQPETPSEADAAAPRVEFPLEAIRSVRLHADRLVPLGALPIERIEPVGPRPFTTPPGVEHARPLGIDDLLIDGPLSATWILPDGSDRLAFTAVLPERARLWGDCTLVVTLARPGQTPSELARVRLHAETPEHALRLDLPGSNEPRRRLNIRVEPGERGPIQNRAVLVRPVLRINEATNQTPR